MVLLTQLNIADDTGEVLAKVARRRGQTVDGVLRSLLGLAGEPQESGPSDRRTFDPVWRRVCDLAGTEFTTRNGQHFTYLVDGQYVSPSTSEVRVPVSQFRKAHAMGRTRGPSSLRGVFAPSLVWAILNDERVAGKPLPEPPNAVNVPLEPRNAHVWAIVPAAGQVAARAGASVAGVAEGETTATATSRPSFAETSQQPFESPWTDDPVVNDGKSASAAAAAPLTRDAPAPDRGRLLRRLFPGRR